MECMLCNITPLKGTLAGYFYLCFFVMKSNHLDAVIYTLNYSRIKARIRRDILILCSFPQVSKSGNNFFGKLE
jgi:hypothetical protein